MLFAQAFDPNRSLKVAWRLLKQTPLTVLIGGLLIGFLESGGGGGGGEAGGRSPDSAVPATGAEGSFKEFEPWLYLLIPLVGCLLLGFFALSSWLEVGFARAIRLGLRTGRDQVGKVFSGGDRLGTMLLARFLSGLLYLAGALPMVLLALPFAALEGGGWIALLILGEVICFIVFTYVWLGVYLVNPIVALEDCTATEAIGRSWRLARGQRWQLFWFVVLQVLLTIAGLCACCIGLLVAVPLTQVMRFEAYIALTQGEQYPQWWIGSGQVPFDEHRGEEFGSPPAPPQVPPPLPPQT